MKLGPNIMPVSFTEANIRAMRDGTKIETRRPAGRLGKCRSGDLLWIREPFHLSLALDGFAPLQAIQKGGAVASFAADWPTGAGHAGKRRNAREMPKALHRYHLIVRAVRQERLHDIDAIGAQAEGVSSRAAYVDLWESIHPTGKTIGGTPVRWADNPLVDVLAFTFVPMPVPVPAAAQELKSGEA